VSGQRTSPARKGGVFSSQILEYVRRVAGEDFGEASPEDRQEFEREIAEIGAALGTLSLDALTLLLMAVSSGVSYQCECGRRIEVDGYRDVTVKERA
jgi:hypothetical protein